MHQGKVKWFNNAKGYGFIVEDGETEDLFAHFSSIQMEGYKTLKAGQAVAFEKQASGKGTHAVSISALETADQSSAQANFDDEIISVEEEHAIRPITEAKTETTTKTTSEQVTITTTA